MENSIIDHNERLGKGEICSSPRVNDDIVSKERECARTVLQVIAAQCGEQ